MKLPDKDVSYVINYAKTNSSKYVIRKDIELKYGIVLR